MNPTTEDAAALSALEPRLLRIILAMARADARRDFDLAQAVGSMYATPQNVEVISH